MIKLLSNAKIYCNIRRKLGGLFSNGFYRNIMLVCLGDVLKCLNLLDFVSLMILRLLRGSPVFTFRWDMQRKYSKKFKHLHRKSNGQEVVFTVRRSSRHE